MFCNMVYDSHQYLPPERKRVIFGLGYLFVGRVLYELNYSFYIEDL